MLDENTIVHGYKATDADIKLVAKWIRLVEEVAIGGDRNTGYYNTGYYNTGDYNTGDRNTGDYNTGDRNTGYSTTTNQGIQSTMSALFRPATRQKVKLRMAIDGVSGSGKTFSALRFAFALGSRVAVINTESGAVEKYIGLAPDSISFQFDVCELSDFAPTKYTEAILAAGSAGYDVIVIDSLSHAWSGSGGALELKDRKGGNSFTAWKDITPMHNQMIEAILRSPCHVIATMRSKTEYVLETDDRGRSVPRKMGMAPIQRQGMEYEFDLYCSIDSEHIMKVSKSRCPDVSDAITVKPGLGWMEPVIKWLNDGSEADASKFAVSEKDLQKLARAEAIELPPAPKKSAAELMAEAAAKVAEQEKPNAIQAAPTASTLVDKEPAKTQPENGESSEYQRHRLNELFHLLGITAEQQETILAKRGLKVLRSLSYEQAQEILDKLEQKLQAAVSTATEAAINEVTPPDSGADTSGQISAREDDPATSDQVKQIKAELKQWEQSEPGITKQFIGNLNGAGFQRIADLTFAQARDFYNDICNRNIANFFESQLATAAGG